ncbi:hypothetical protein, partial [Micromonospora noduli]|uniref:hypothetical protein n=1 Tax=Micromonospora noduli TaxID=709876 RepID=UPI001C65E170
MGARPAGRAPIGVLPAATDVAASRSTSPAGLDRGDRLGFGDVAVSRWVQYRGFNDLVLIMPGGPVAR